jgi:hypothetical protein
MRLLVFTATLTATLAAIAAPSMACGPGSMSRAAHAAPRIEAPALGHELDRLLPKATLSDEERAKVIALRAEMTKRARAQDETGARKAEEQAMAVLGYQKGWMACGPGTFFWLPVQIGKRAEPAQG